MAHEPHLFPRVIRQIRESRGLSQSDLAEKCGVSQPAVAGWESGERPILETTLEKIAKALGEPVEDLLARALRQLRKAARDAA
jgi:transcriptional regulator with XRE-family HTH domain